MLAFVEPMICLKAKFICSDKQCVARLAIPGIFQSCGCREGADLDSQIQRRKKMWRSREWKGCVAYRKKIQGERATMREVMELAHRCSRQMHNVQFPTADPHRKL